MLIRLFFILLMLANQAAANQKIASLNLCSDILLLQLTNETHQLSLTYLSREMQPYVTIPTSTQFNRGLVEEISVFQPNIIFAHTFTNGVTIQRLKQLGWSVVQLQAAQTIGDIYQNIQKVGEVIQRLDKAQQLIYDIQSKLANMPQLVQQNVLLFYPNGFTVGQQTLASHILEHMGLHNLAKEIGISFWGKISLEHLIQHQPDVIILSTQYQTQSALATRLQQHHLFKSIPHIKVDNRLWQCGTPLILKMMQDIHENIPAP